MVEQGIRSICSSHLKEIWNEKIDGTEAKLVYQTSARVDDQGVAVIDLQPDLAVGRMYYILGIPEGVSTITRNNEITQKAFSYAAIANAMDCFVLP